MENSNLLNELVGRKVLIKTNFGGGTKDNIAVGGYKGTILSFDGNFVKVKYEVKTFLDSGSKMTSSEVLINIADIITIEQYQEEKEQP
ncbi:MAG: hypothetical protein ACREBH_00165 [Candidatus Micrarchaeaceae archaeon]